MAAVPNAVSSSSAAASIPSNMSSPSMCAPAVANNNKVSSSAKSVSNTAVNSSSQVAASAAASSAIGGSGGTGSGASGTSAGGGGSSGTNVVQNIPMVSQYIQTGMPFYQPPVYSYEEIQMMQQRMPHVVSLLSPFSPTQQKRTTFFIKKSNQMTSF